MMRAKVIDLPCKFRKQVAACAHRAAARRESPERTKPYHHHDLQAVVGVLFCHMIEVFFNNYTPYGIWTMYGIPGC